MLNGWKAIATFLGRDERTAMRWAADRGLPVHRAPGPGRGSVYALAEEIDAWLAADRERTARLAFAATPSAIVPPEAPGVVARSAPRWGRGGWAALSMIAGGMLLVAVGALTLHRSDPASALEPAFTDSTAKAVFLQATYDWNLRTRDSLARAVQEYGDAIGRDPRVPAAYVGLANSYLLLGEYGSMPDRDAYPRAEAAAQAAVTLAPQSAEAHRALAFIAFWWRQDRATARREFARAIALKPDDPLTHHWFATALIANGEAQAALHEIDIARDIDPTGTAVLADRGMILYVAGQHAEGLKALQTLEREQPESAGPHRSLAEIALFEGRTNDFLGEWAEAARLRGDGATLAEVARWKSAGSDTAVKAAMLRDARQQHQGWFRIAQAAAVAGRASEAKTALSHACDTREPATVSAASDLWLSRALSPEDVSQRCGRLPRLS